MLNPVSQENSEEIYIPPPGSKIPDPNVSGIAKRLTRRRKKIDTPATYVRDKNLTSSDEQFSESSESSENSDPPVFRKSRSVLPSLKPTIIPVKENSPPKSAPPRMPPRSPWLMSTLDQYVDVYVNGACSYNVSEESKAGVGIWFGPNHPLNVSRLAKGRQTNKAAKIEAAIEAAHRARKAGISKLRINTDSKFLINSAKEWIPTWEAKSCGRPQTTNP